MLISVLLLVLSANLDTFVIAVSCGMKNIKIPRPENLIISLITTAGTYLSMALGEALADFLPIFLANILGSFILLAIGLASVCSYCYKAIKKVPQEIGSEEKGGVPISAKRSAAIAAALCLNNVALGIAASVSGVDAVATAVCTFFVTMLFLILGTAAGRSELFRRLGKFAPLVSGILLLILGTAELFV